VELRDGAEGGAEGEGVESIWVGTQLVGGYYAANGGCYVEGEMTVHGYR
jgi:hypothetical protein